MCDNELVELLDSITADAPRPTLRPFTNNVLMGSHRSLHPKIVSEGEEKPTDIAAIAAAMLRAPKVHLQLYSLARLDAMRAVLTSTSKDVREDYASWPKKVDGFLRDCTA